MEDVVNSFMTLAVGVWTVMAVILIAMLIVGVVFYILYGRSHHKVFKALGYKHPGWAWIPLFNIWALASCAFQGEKDAYIFRKIKVPLILLQLSWLIQSILGRIPAVGFYIGTAYYIIALGTCYIRLYSIIEGKEESEVTVIGYLTGFCTLIATFKWLKLDVSQITPNVQVQVNQANIEAQRLADVYNQPEQQTAPINPVQPTQQVRHAAPNQSVKASAPTPAQQVQQTKPVAPTQQANQSSTVQGATATSTGTLVFNSSSKKK